MIIKIEKLTKKDLTDKIKANDNYYQKLEGVLYLFRKVCFVISAIIL